MEQTLNSSVEETGLPNAISHRSIPNAAYSAATTPCSLAPLLA